MNHIQFLKYTLMSALFLAGCQTANRNIGEGPITLSRNVETRLQSYLANPGSSYFAVSTDGRNYSYSYCADGSVCEESGGTIALRSCRERSNGVPCKIYAVGDRVVWRGASGSGERLQKANTEIGTSPLTLFPSFEQRYAKYLAKESPEYFAVSTDGLHAGYSFCENIPCVTPGARELAISSCNRRSPGTECRIYAIGRKVVWKGTVSRYSDGNAGNSPNDSNANRWASDDDTTLCRAALHGSQAAHWTTNRSYRDAVAEAKRRGL